jgi:hypothetical protein
MKTRSQTKTELVNHNVEKTPTYEVAIDFDEASRAWHANKKCMGNSTYKYICVGKNKCGKACSKTPLKNENYCVLHKPKCDIMPTEL